MKKVLLDTNILLRLFLNDIPTQNKKAQRIINSIEKQKQQGLVSLLVINELIWILEKFYKYKRQDFTPLIFKILSLKKVRVVEIKKAWLVEILKNMIQSNLDFTDLYLAFLKKKEGFELETFDKKLKKFSVL